MRPVIVLDGGLMRLGIDLGGTKTEIIALDDAGRELLRRRVPTPREAMTALLAAITELVAGAESELGAQRQHRHRDSRHDQPAHRPDQERQLHLAERQAARADLEAALGGPCRCANDANCFALSEATDGAGRARCRVRRDRRAPASAAAWW